MKITEVQIVPIKPKDGLVGFASVVLDGCFYLGSIGVHSRLDGSGLRLTYPTKKVGSENINIFHPLNILVSQEVEEAIFEKYKDLMNKVTNEAKHRSN